MLAQSMNFYQDEFAGRIATKVMQTALAVRDTWLIAVRAHRLHRHLLRHAARGAGRLRCAAASCRSSAGSWLYLAALWFFVPRLGAVGKLQADARSLMTGRITDAYTNIATVKLFSHAKREASLRARRDAGVPRHRPRADAARHRLRDRQPHPVASASIAGHRGHDAVAVDRRARSASARSRRPRPWRLRLNGISHWVMWEMAALFEHIGTVQDGINTLSRPHAVVDAPDAQPLVVTRGDIRFEHVSFGYGGSDNVIDDLSLHIRPGEKIGLVGRSGAGKSTIVNLLLRFYDVEQRPHPDRRPGHRARHAGEPARADRHGHAGHLAPAPLGARQHRVRPPRRQRGRDASPPPSAPRRTTSSTTSPTPRDAAATTRTWASAA